MKGPDTGGRILDAYKDQFLAGIFFHKSRVDSDSAFFVDKGIGHALLQSQAQFGNIFPAGSADAQIKSIRQSTPKLQPESDTAFADPDLHIPGILPRCLSA